MFTLRLSLFPVLIICKVNTDFILGEGAELCPEVFSIDRVRN